MPIYVPTTSDQIAQDFLEDLELEARAIGIENPPTQVKSDWWLLSRAIGKLGLTAFTFIQDRDSARSALTAEGEDLVAIRNALQIPDIPPQKSRGKLTVSVSGVASIASGTRLTRTGGIQYEVDGTFAGVTDGTDIDIVAVSAGKAGDAPAGTALAFASPPLGVSQSAKVSARFPVVGGRDIEGDDDLRDRISLRLASPPAGGNTGFLREKALGSGVALQEVFVYPAIGGPASVKVVPVVAPDFENLSITRELSSSALAVVRGSVQSQVSEGIETVVESAANELVDVSIQVDIPNSSTAGGTGGGWVDGTPWPQLETSDAGRVSVSSVTNSRRIVVSADTTTAPVAGQTHVAWWAPGDQQFRRYLVTSVAGSPGAWDLTLDRPLVDSLGNSVASGDYVSPDAENVITYGEAWRELMAELGPGENTSDPNILQSGRALRRPLSSEQFSSSLSTRLLAELVAGRDEMLNAAYAYRSKTVPTVPASVEDPPNILLLDNFGVYPS
jgi:hypothetical protein